MEGMFEFDAVIKTIDGEVTKPVAITIGMGLRVIEDAAGICWISLADNSIWKSPDDYRTTVDKISGTLRHL